MKLEGRIKMKTYAKLLGYMVLSLGLVVSAMAQKTRPVSKVLITNVNVFDGKSDSITPKTDVLIEGNLIKAVGKDLDAKGATVIDGGGRVLMPGLIEAHGHLSIVTDPLDMANKRTFDYIGALMGEEAERYLMRGFTALRDAGGPVFGLKQAIDEGWIPGPRIFPSGAVISQTSGHADFRNFNAKSSYFSGASDYFADMGYSYLADGVPEVQKAARENLRLGASQLKVTVGGGVTSLYDPLDATQYTLEELKAIVAEAKRWGTYVMVHAHADDAIIQALDAGVKSIEHGMLIKEETMERIAKEGTWLSPQAFIVLQDVSGNPTFSDPIQREKLQRTQEGAANEFKWAKKHKVKVAWGTDMFGARAAFDTVLNEFEYRGRFFTNVEQLQQVTGNNGELLALSGIRNPYPNGALGVIKPGAYADLLIVEGNPLEDIKVMMDPEKNLKLIMKDGKIYKNILPERINKMYREWQKSLKPTDETYTPPRY
jgi:imidazolonepropionase-like amidohydrolase